MRPVRMASRSSSDRRSTLDATASRRCSARGQTQSEKRANNCSFTMRISNYFLGIAPGRYQAILSTFISGWDAKALKARVAFGLPDNEALEPPENALERRYALRTVKQRLHQASFREAVITAYNGRCALSGLPEPLLLDAAHIVADKDERFGQPLVPNGIPLSKIHHAAFDAHLIGIDPDFRIHVSDRLLGQNDGPMLEAFKRLNGRSIRLPGRTKDHPDKSRLA